MIVILIWVPAFDNYGNSAIELIVLVVVGGRGGCFGAVKTHYGNQRMVFTECSTVPELSRDQPPQPEHAPAAGRGLPRPRQSEEHGSFRMPGSCSAPCAPGVMNPSRRGASPQQKVLSNARY